MDPKHPTDERLPEESDEEIDAVRRQLQEREIAFQQCVIQLAEAQRTNAQAKRANDEAQLRMSAQLAAAELTFLQANERLRGQQQDLTLLRKELVRIVHQCEIRGAELDRMHQRMEQLEAALEQAEAEASDRQPDPSSAEGQRFERRAQDAVVALAQRDERIAELETQQSTNETQQGRLEALIADREARYAELEKNLRQTHGDLTASEARLVELEAERTELRTSVQERETHIARLEVERTELQTWVEEREMHIARLKAERTELRASVEERETHIARIEAERTELRTCVDERETHIARLETERSELRSCVDERETDIARLEANNARNLLHRTADLIMPAGSRRRSVFARLAGRQRPRDS